MAAGIRPSHTVHGYHRRRAGQPTGSQKLLKVQVIKVIFFCESIAYEETWPGKPMPELARRRLAVRTARAAPKKSLHQTREVVQVLQRLVQF